MWVEAFMKESRLIQDKLLMLEKRIVGSSPFYVVSTFNSSKKLSESDIEKLKRIQRNRGLYVSDAFEVVSETQRIDFNVWNIEVLDFKSALKRVKQLERKGYNWVNKDEINVEQLWTEHYQEQKEAKKEKAKKEKYSKEHPVETWLKAAGRLF
jgi:hypothetical protein